MAREDPFERKVPRPVAVGTGLVALDVVIPDDAEMPRLWAGGTCGNVLALLVYLGWQAYPIARLGKDGPARWITQDFAACGVNTDFLTHEPGGATPVIVQHIRTQAGVATHSFSWRCPICGSDLPRYKPLRLSDLAAIHLQLPAAEVFFLDRVSASALRLAERYAALGALIVFEPSGVGDLRLFRDALELTHILKFSRDRLGGSTEVVEAKQPSLVIETLGGDGLRYRSRLQAVTKRGWQHLAVLPTPGVKDTAGAGDWCTAGLLQVLGSGGLSRFSSADDQHLRRALRFGQALAAWNCRFEGARGGMYGTPRNTVEESVRAMLSGGEQIRPQQVSPSGNVLGSPQFACTSCPRDDTLADRLTSRVD